MRRLNHSLLATACVLLLVFPIWAISFAQEFAPEKTFYIPVKQGKALAFFINQNKLAVIFMEGENTTVRFYYLSSSPEPNPDPEPEPNPQPSNIVAIYWVEETLERTPEQAILLSSKKVRDSIQQKGLSFQVVDKDIKNEFGQTPTNLIPIISAAKKIPSLVLLNKEGKVTVIDTPKDENEFISLLEGLK